MSHDELAAFAHAVLKIAAAAPKSHRVGQKVFLAALGVVDGERLFAAHRADLLTLSRCDLVEAFDRRTVAASLVRARGAEFHFVTDPAAREEWLATPQETGPGLAETRVPGMKR